MSDFRLAGAASGGPPRWLLRLVVAMALLGAVYQSGILRSLKRRSPTAVLAHISAVVSQYQEAATEAGDADDSSNGGGGAAGEEPAAVLLKPDPPADLEKRCAGTQGTWCKDFFMQTPIPAKPPPRYNKTCLWGCNFVGVCDQQAGWCRCPAGWTGDDCSTRQRRPCAQNARASGFEPNYLPNDLSKPRGLNSRCAQLCDEDIGYCFCNSTWTYGHQLAAPDQPPGTPPVKRGRPLGFHCQPNKDEAGNEIHYGENDPADLWGPEGWCTAEKPKINCPCILDGYTGQYCDKYSEQFCVNQCNGHGECNLGFCKCHDGWWGQDCSYRTHNTSWSPGLEETSRPWLKDHVHCPSCKDPEPGATRKRPLIYVYELPALFNSVMLQYRVDRGTCVHRLFHEDNATHWIDGWGYVAEPALHEALLQSPHRTLDPEEADFFYMPVHSSCYLYPIHGFNDAPFFHAFHNIQRVHAATNMLIEAHAWVRSHHPYWDRNGGRDHIVLMTHDEGSCWLPAGLRPAILLTHWGRMDLGHISNTGYGPDNYTQPGGHPIYMPEGMTGKYGNFPCYDPSKDLVIPPMTSAAKYSQSPLVGGPPKKHSIFAFFKGRTQQNNPPYSRGIRQTLENLCRDNDWWNKYKIHLGEGYPEGVTGSYTEVLAASTLCFVLPGDGFSPRFEDAVHHGCIPVIIQDNVHLGFESIFDFDSFAIRIAEKDMARVPEILTVLTPADIEAKQRGLAALWRRFAYTGYKSYGSVTRRLLDGCASKGSGQGGNSTAVSLPAPECDYNVDENDAMETIYAWLHSRIPHTRGPQAEAEQQQSGTSKQPSGSKKASRKEAAEPVEVE